MSDIKTKPTAAIKKLDKAGKLAGQAKDTAIRIKERAEQATDGEQAPASI